jgi:glycosyltransferase involved in cell wall biosynthesis
VDVRRAGGLQTATCLVLSRTFDSDDERLVRVRGDVCDACCAVAEESPLRINHVVASLVYERAHRELTERPSGPGAPRLVRLKEEARHRLQSAPAGDGRVSGGLGVLGVGERRLPSAAARSPERTWAVGVLTAPRDPPTLGATLESLNEAGFDEIHFFAEPDSMIPPACLRFPLVRHGKRQGPLRNFCFAARYLLEVHPDVDCYALFEDDISAASGLRCFCEQEFWPGDHGIVSLYTSRVYSDDRPGWQTLNLGRYRTFGALALVFRGSTLREMLADPDVRRHVSSGHPGADAVVGEWALKRGIGIAYHTPSLVQHTGEKSSVAGHEVGRVGHALAAARAGDFSDWRPPEAQLGRVGLIGWNTATGLGYQNRGIAVNLPVARWFAVRHPRFSDLAPPNMPGEYRLMSPRAVSAPELRGWMRGLDWLLFVETPSCVQGAVQQARELGLSVACIPNWEWLHPALDWLPFVDLMICPTRFTYRMLLRWRRELRFAWDVVHVPWPIDAGEFTYRRRQRCGRFLFANGTGGGRARRLDGSITGYHRKGVELIAATARLMKRVPFLVYSQCGDLPRMPENVDVRHGPGDNRELYVEGDVCVQPSHWEGLGLNLLECQAAGLPLVTSDAPPMNECRPFRAVPVYETELVFVSGNQPVDSNVIRPEDLAVVLDGIYGMDLCEASDQSRAYIEEERSWCRMRAAVTACLTR